VVLPHRRASGGRAGPVKYPGRTLVRDAAQVAAASRQARRVRARQVGTASAAAGRGTAMRTILNRQKGTGSGLKPGSLLVSAPSGRFSENHGTAPDLNQ
jgi:hypothetical protein